MGKTMGDILVSLFSCRSTSYENELLTWAKTEYGNDWRFAYQHMLDNHGKAPKMGIMK